MAKPAMLPILGYQNRPVPNRFYKQEPPATRLAVLFPGLGYTPDLPLLYYTSQVLLAHGLDLLQLRPDYLGEAFQTASAEDRLEWLSADAAAALKVGMAQADYQQVVLGGKSIGTLTMALVLPLLDPPQPPVTIWLTPLLRESLVVEAALECQAPLFFIAGSGDSTFIPSAMNMIQKRTSAQIFLAENANHSLEIPDEPIKSLEILGQCMEAFSRFLDQALGE